MNRHTRLNIAVATALTALGSGAAWSADPAKIDWSAIAMSEVVLFYPGQASYQWMLSTEHRKGGAKGVREGEPCLECHKGEEAAIGDKIVSGKRLEPNPIAGKVGSIKVTLQAAYDSEYLYLRANWPAKNPGNFHAYVVYRDGNWQDYSSHRADEAVVAGKLRASYEERFSIMLGDGKSVPSFNTAGCWASCHSDVNDMPNEAKKADIEAHPILGKAGMKRSDTKKYLPETRSAMGPTGGWDKSKTKEEIEALRAKGVFVDLWQWNSYRTNAANMANDGYVLEYRNSDSGKAPAFGNWDGAKKQPLFMFDPAQNGGRAGLTEAEFHNPKAPILREKNRVAYDPKFPWKNGDLMKKQGIGTAEGSAADNAPVVGTHAGGAWTVVWRRKLNTGNNDDIALKPGESYPVGIAIHNDSVADRWHHVSFPLKLSIGRKDGNINAVQVK